MTHTFANVMHCEACNDSGLVVVMEDGQRKYGHCACAEKRRTLLAMKRSGLESSFDKFRFDNFCTGAQYQQRMLDVCRAFINQEAQRFLFINGQTGTGKTHIGTAVCAHYIGLGRRTLYTTYAQLMSELKCCVNDEAYGSTLYRYGDAAVLYIDDFMKFPPTEADKKHAFELINLRVVKGGITIITSERTLDDIMAIDEALGGRIKEMSGEFAFSVAYEEGRNWRLKMGAGKRL